jgi:hypothetical protein
VEVRKLAKFIVNEEVAMTVIEKWQSGELTKALFRDVFSKSQELKCCDTCGFGKGPLSALGVQGKCYCTRSRLYEKSTHYCAEWKEKKKCQ